MHSPAIQLPEKLPLPYETVDFPLPKQLKSWDRSMIEAELTTLIEKGIWPEKSGESDHLCLFIRAVAQDFEWKRTNPELTRKIFQAASNCLFDPSLAPQSERMKAIVRNCNLSIGNFLPNDAKIVLQGRITEHSSLALAAGSPFFERLFSWPVPGNNYPNNYPIEDVNPIVFEYFAHILQKGKTPQNFAPTDQEIGELIAFADRMESAKEILRCLDAKLSGRTFDKTTAAFIYPFTSITNTPNARKACFNTLSSESDTPKEVDELIAMIKKYEPEEDQTPLLEELNQKFNQVTINAHNVQGWYDLASKNNIPLLKRRCLDLVYKNLSLEKAYRYAEHSLFPAEQELVLGVFINTKDREEYCRDWLMDKAASWFNTLEHKWDPRKQTFDGKGESLKALFHLSKEKKDAIANLQEFEKHLKSFYNLSSKGLERYSQRELEWILTNLRSNSVELDLSHSKIGSLRILERFKNLQRLSLKGCTDAQGLHGKLKTLQYLDLRDSGVDLKKIGKLKELQTLLLRSKEWIDLAPLAPLGKLKLLDLRGSVSEQIMNQNKVSKDCKILT